MIDTKQHDGVLEIVIDNPPVNALGTAVRQELDRAILLANEDASIQAIVVRGAGKMFSAGADISEFGKPPVEPMLAVVLGHIEQCNKPVVAAIHGSCFGGGLEVTLACHYRIAAASAKVGLPEVKLGILPGAGGTQRVPRLVGVAAALEMIVGGEPMGAKKAAELGLIEKVVDDDKLVSEAIAFARACVANGPRRSGDRVAHADEGVFDKFIAENHRKIKGLDAAAACIEAIRVSTELPLAEGLVRERALFQGLVGGSQAKALRHIFFAERTAAKIEGLPADVVRRKIARVGIIGAGTMGGGIAMNFLGAGIPVTIVETTKEALDRGTGVVRKNYHASAAKGRMKPEQVEAAMALLTPSLDLGALADCDLVIEAVYENIEVKREIFTKLDAIAKPGAILATNTSYLDVDAIAAFTKRPSDVVGLHFFSPANVMKLVEVVRGAKTAPDVLATAMDLARTIKKVPVVAGVCHGFIGNRMLKQRQSQALALLVEGATPEQVDRVHTEFGLPMGPFQMADLAGVDVGWHRDPTRIESIRDALNAQGRFGQKVKAGFYDYDEKRRSTPSPITGAIIEKFRAAAKLAPRTITDDEIVARTLYTMVNEGLEILDEKIAQRASDIDVVWVFGYGWPNVTGGPMFWADSVGLDNVAAGLATFAERLGPDFRLAQRFRH